jgi:DNA-binding MarR family transcriptional regulator/GNAT superfamily N-acetyltransferase
MMTGPDLIRTAEAIRNFNHFYARHAGGLQERIRSSKFSTNEVRLLHALAIGGAQTSATVARQLNLDTGYLSRLLTRFESRGYITRRVDTRDSRRHFIILTSAGRATFDAIDSNGIGEMSVALRGFTRCERAQLASSMADIARLLSPPVDCARLHVRGARRGDFGWIVERCAQLDPADHARSTYEAHAVEIVARVFGMGQPSAPRASCWIAEQENGARVGAAVVIAASGSEARIELLFVEPGARRRGLGQRLVDACSAFASEAGFERLTCCIEESRADLHRLAEQTCFALRERVAAGSVWQRSLASQYA